MIQQRRNNTVYTGISLLICTLLISLAVACSQRTQATQSGQATSQSSIEEEVFTIVEVPPSFSGGNAQISSYLRKNLRYPEAAIKAKVQGRVLVSFLVTKEGAIRDVTILKGYGYGIDEEATRLVQAMPTWVPGRQAGRAVNVKYNLVIPFELATLK